MVLQIPASGFLSCSSEQKARSKHVFARCPLGLLAELLLRHLPMAVPASVTWPKSHNNRLNNQWVKIIPNTTPLVLGYLTILGYQPPGCGAGHLALGGPTGAGSGPGASSGPCPPWPCYDSAVLYYASIVFQLARPVLTWS